MVRITRHGLGEALDLDRKFDRITLACGAQTPQAEASVAIDAVLQLTLDIEVRAAVTCIVLGWLPLGQSGRRRGPPLPARRGSPCFSDFRVEQCQPLLADVLHELAELLDPLGKPQQILF